MAENASNQVPTLVNRDDVRCPICLDEFQEPKALPQCQHNMCKTCLQEMCGPSKRVKCPVCRTTSTLPQDGIDGLPTNHLLKNLIENMPGRKEKQALEKALQGFRKSIKMSSTRLAETKKLLEAEEKQVKEWHPQKVKDEISGHAQSLINTIAARSKTLCHQVDDIIAKKHSKVKQIHRSVEYLSNRISDANKTKNEVENTLQQNDAQKFIEQKENMINMFERLDALMTFMKTAFPATGHNAIPGAVKFVASPCCTGEEILGRLAPLYTLLKMKQVLPSIGIRRRLDTQKWIQ